MRVLLRGLPLLTAVAILAILARPSSSAAADESTQTISLEEFKSSRFSVLFQRGDYAGALGDLESLLKRYPGDTLLRRYRAITLDRLGRSEEAIAELKQLLRQDPEHLPTRHFLAQAYANAGRIAEAVKEWQWVSEHGAGLPYREWAREGLRRFQPVLAASAVPTRWFLAGTSGWEWDSNVLLKPEDKRLASPGDQNANRFFGVLQGGYRLVRERDRAVDAVYTTRHSFHDDGLDDFNFISEELTLAARQRAGALAKQPLWLNGRYDLLVGFLDQDLFSWSNRFTAGVDSRLSPRTRTALTGQCALTNFGPDGSNPSQTSRDGIYSSIELEQVLFSPDFRSYLYLSQAYTDARTRGGNFERRGTATRVGMHLPLIRRIEADASVGFEWGRYPRFSALSSLDVARRRDADWDFYLAFSRPLTPRLLGRVYYRFVRADNRNDFFEYRRHITGVQILF